MWGQTLVRERGRGEKRGQTSILTSILGSVRVGTDFNSNSSFSTRCLISEEIVEFIWR